MKPRVGVLLSGCGFLDGAEIHESVLTMLHLDQAGVAIDCIAPKGPQSHVVNHLTGQEVPGASRDVLEEAARIARGKIRDLAGVKAEELDALVMPGGFGAAKNLSDFATKGAEASPHPEVARLLREMRAAGKPIGAVCISPAVVAAALGREFHPVLTIGSDRGTAQALEAMGARHEECPVTGCRVDETNRIVSTPAYMCDARISEVSAGISAMVDKLLSMVGAGHAVGG